jgi:hypothetical protein
MQTAEQGYLREREVAQVEPSRLFSNRRFYPDSECWRTATGKHRWRSWELVSDQKKKIKKPGDCVTATN